MPPCSWLHTSFTFLYTAPTLTTLSYVRHCSSVVPESNVFLICNALSCVFAGQQILRVRRNPELLPHISLAMLVMLSLGHMVQFVSIFQNNKPVNFDGWLDVNAVAVGLTAVVAMLLHMRLAGLVWAARQEESLRSGEKRSVFVLAALYAFGGLLTLLWNMDWKGDYWRHSLSEDLRSYADLILDGFLLPQVLLTVFSGSIEKALARSFYFGTSVVRLLPHAYHQYRRSDGNEIYYRADPTLDLILISSGLIALAVIVDQI